jgi:hypothetical protein
LADILLLQRVGSITKLKRLLLRLPSIEQFLQFQEA